MILIALIFGTFIAVTIGVPIIVVVACIRDIYKTADAVDGMGR